MIIFRKKRTVSHPRTEEEPLPFAVAHSVVPETWSGDARDGAGSHWS
jgi:hypothetical protein